jgi:acyl dehydratase
MELDLSVVGRTLEPPPFAYDWKRCALYALGIGAGPDELDYVWEGSKAFKVAPSFAVVPTFPIVVDALTKVRADMRTVVHGEQAIRLHAPIPREGTLHGTGRVSAVYDKGKAALVMIDTETKDAAGNRLFDTTWSIFCRGQGGFGGDRGPTPALPEAAAGAAPQIDREMGTAPNQALLYRLGGGDMNPLHVDPALATKVGFPAPILHGLATFGFATRAVLRDLCGGDPARLKAISVRFSREVYPGETLRVRAVPSTTPGTSLLEASVGDRTVLSHGVVEIG